METVDTQVFKGELEFINFFKPIKLYVFRGEIEWLDLWPNLHKVFEYLNDRRTLMVTGMNTFGLKHDPESEYKIKYKNNGKYMSITNNSATGMSNVAFYLSNQLERLNGRKIIATITESSVFLEPDPEYKVPEIYYTHDNSCALEAEHVENICKPGTLDTCIFLTLGGQGFMCEKFNSGMAGTLLQRFGEGNMKASRIGHCSIAGRKDAPKPKITLEQYPEIQKLIIEKARYIGWKLIDSGDAMDRGILDGRTTSTVVTDILFELSEDSTIASLTIKGKDFDCGVNVKYGGVRNYNDGADIIHFYGYMGHSFTIINES